MNRATIVLFFLCIGLSAFALDGDINGDDRVDAQDLLLLRSNWTGAAEPRPETTITVSAGVSIQFVLVPAGNYFMGRYLDYLNDNVGEHVIAPLHPVQIRHPFWIGKYEMTQGQWLAVMGSWPQDATPTPVYGFGKDYPMYGASWNDCHDFVNRLNQKGLGFFRLPSETEWEYACRAGSSGLFFWGNDARLAWDYAWFAGNTQGTKVYPVGTKKPNAWGLFDIVGNVAEYCEDDGGGYESWDVATWPATETPYVTTPRGADRVVRGGGNVFSGTPLYGCESSFRTWRYPDGHGDTEPPRLTGFRLVMEP